MSRAQVFDTAYGLLVIVLILLMGVIGWLAW